MSSKRQRRPEARPDEILDAALEVFTKQGFAAARMDDVAKKAGLSKGALYLYFDSKDAIFEAIVKRFADNFASVVAGRIEDFSERNPEQALRDAIAFVVTVLSDSAASAAPRLVLAEAARFPKIAALYRREVIDMGRRAIGALLAEGARRGIFRDIDGEMALRAVVGPVVVHMLLTHVLVDETSREMDPAAVARSLADSVLNGLKVRPS